MTALRRRKGSPPPAWRQASHAVRRISRKPAKAARNPRPTIETAKGMRGLFPAPTSDVTVWVSRITPLPRYRCCPRCGEVGDIGAGRLKEATPTQGTSERLETLHRPLDR